MNSNYPRIEKENAFALGRCNWKLEARPRLRR